MQPQEAQMMGQVAPAGAMGQQVIIVQNKAVDRKSSVSLQLSLVALD